MFSLISPQFWREYELLDVGNQQKLERWGEYITIRPEPQALWDASLSESHWLERAHAVFKKEKNAPEKGFWVKNKPFDDQNWTIPYLSPSINIRFKLSLSSFKHVGLFPEQADNWEYLYKNLKLFSQPTEVLNLFAYTGGASLAAAKAGAKVYHVDSVKPVITWANQNREISNVQTIHWVVEDVLAFVKREVKRKKKYHAIILDPPAYGRGPKGEKWIIEEHLNELLHLCQEILHDKHILILNLYSLGFSALIAHNLVQKTALNNSIIDYGECYLEDSFSKKLPLGCYARSQNITK